MAALAIRLYRLGHFSLWLDEILEVFTIHDSWRGLIGSLRWQGLQAPLDYAVGWLVDALHPSDALRKVPAALYGAATVVAAGRLVARRVGRSAGVVAAAFLALSPFHVRYSQELRPYGLGLLLLVLALLALDRHLEKPSFPRLATLYAASLATAYALYVASLALAVAGGAMVLEDAFAADPLRRKAARRFLARSPIFVLALWIGFRPWWPVFLTGVRLPSEGTIGPFRFARIERLASFFGFGVRDWAPFGPADAFFAALCAIGAVAAWKNRARFVVVWAIAGFTIFEAIERRRPMFDSIFHALPMGLALPILFALGIGALLARRATRPLGIGIAALAFVLEVRSLHAYFTDGRPDWRPLAASLSREPFDERILTENAWAQICVGYSVGGPGWMHAAATGHAREVRSIENLDRRTDQIPRLWPPGQTAWLVLYPPGGASPVLEKWAERFPGEPFPTAEGGAVVKRLRAEERSTALTELAGK